MGIILSVLLHVLIDLILVPCLKVTHKTHVRFNSNVNGHVPLHMAAVVRVIVTSDTHELAPKCVCTRHDHTRLGMMHQFIHLARAECLAVNACYFYGLVI